MPTNSELYVCITHQSIAPCEVGEYHLLSNWTSDVHKILKMIEKNNV